MKRRSRDRSFEKREEIEITQLDQEADIGVGAPLKVYRLGHCTVYAGETPWGQHLAISHPRRFPTWEEVATARYALVGDDVTMALVLPPDVAYLKVHPNTLQLWQINQENPHG